MKEKIGCEKATMGEKVVIKSEQYNVKKLLKTLVLIGLVIALLGTIVSFLDACNRYNELYGADHEHYIWCYEYYYEDDFYEDMRNGGLKEWKMCCPQVVYGNAFSYAVSYYFEVYFVLYIICFAAFALIGGLIYLWLRSYELTITDKRIYGKTAWGKRVDLPIDSVSAVGMKWPKGISIGTSSGRISFLLIKNRDDIHKCVSSLLIERQRKPAATTTTKSDAPKSDVEELKQYKELLDSGIITQEEFNAKKKQLLGL